VTNSDEEKRRHKKEINHDDNSKDFVGQGFEGSCAEAPVRCCSIFPEMGDA
jgi:hypothetical protein